MNDKLEVLRNIKLNSKDIALIKEITDDGFDEDSFIESLIGFEDTIRGQGKSTQAYIKAVQFCSLVGVGLSQTEAYSKCYPERAKIKKTQGDNVLSSSASIYANGQMVKSIMQRMYLHNSLLFIDKEFKARKRLFEIGMSGEGKTNVEALKVFLDNQYRDKDKSGFEININTSGGDEIEKLNNALTGLAERQEIMMKRDMMTLKEVAEAKI